MQTFLSILEKAHNAGLGSQFDHLIGIFSNEVGMYIDDHYVISEEEDILEMEDFMDDMNKKRGKK